MTKSEALAEMLNPTYDQALQKQDRLYIMKKLGLSEDEYNLLISAPSKSFRDYPNSYSFVQFLRNLVNIMRRFGLYPK
jgi:hypothetical protein